MKHTKSWITFSLIGFFTLSLFASCRNVRIKDHQEWGNYFKQYKGIQDAGFEMYDNNKEIAMYFNKERCSKRLIPGSVFDIFNAMAALSSNVALNDQFKLPITDSISHVVDTISLVQAFKSGNKAYFRQLIPIVGVSKLQSDLDTVQFGNRKMGKYPANCYNNGSLLITPDELVGFMKQLYHGKLPAFDQRSMRLVQKMMLQEDSGSNRLYYRTATVSLKNDTTMHWLVGVMEHLEPLKSVKTGKMQHIPHPYFFAMNYTTTVEPKGTHTDWNKISVAILEKILKANHENE